MSDRLAVFNHGRIEQVGAPGGGLRAPATPLRRRVRRDVEPADRATSREAVVGARRHVHGPAREDPHRRPGGRRRRRRDRRPGAIHDVVYLGPDTRYVVASTPARDWSSPSRTSRRRRPRHSPTGPGCPAHLEAAARPRRSRTGDAPGGGDRMKTRTGCWGSSRARPSPPRPARWWPCRPRAPAACCGSAGGARREAERPPAPRAMHGSQSGRPEGEHQRPGLAGLRRERLDRPDRRLGDATSRQQTGCKVKPQSSARPTRRYTLFIDEPGAVRRRLGVRRRQPAARPGRLRPAGQRRPGAELRRHLPGAQGQAVQHGRRRRTTASRTAAAPTC